MACIELKDVDVSFPLLQLEHRSFKRALSVSLTSTRFGSDRRNRPVLCALKRMNLELDHGDRVAVIGANGAGKSTLLRVLAGIYPPVAGSIVVDGRVGALLTTGLGMRDDVSGYDNIDFCLLLQGASAAKCHACVTKSPLLQNSASISICMFSACSSGMRVRLAFAISTALNPEILVIDEIFGAGDERFMKKAEKRMIDLIARSSILVFASHSNALL